MLVPRNKHNKRNILKCIRKRLKSLLLASIAIRLTKRAGVFSSLLPKLSDFAVFGIPDPFHIKPDIF